MNIVSHFLLKLISLIGVFLSLGKERIRVNSFVKPTVFILCLPLYLLLLVTFIKICFF